MHDGVPAVFRHGPLRVLAVPLRAPPDLERVAAALAVAPSRDGISSPPRAERGAPGSVTGSPLVWLDSARPHPVTGRWSLLGWDPWLRLTAQDDRLTLRTGASTRVWRGDPLDALRGVLRRYAAAGRLIPQARALGLLGFLSYDLNRWIERLPTPQAGGQGLPTMAWFGMRLVVLVDHAASRGWLLSLADPHSPPALAHREAEAALARAHDLLRACEEERPVSLPASGPAAALLPTMTRDAYEAMVEHALDYIRAGDIFQANVAQRFTARWAGDPLALYRRLRRVNPSPFACYLASDDLAVASCSPERLVRVQGGRVETRPIAGTRPRGATAQEDAVNNLELLLSEKERAEHIMLVDLARNDLGRVSEPGSVAADDLMTVEAYSHVMHIVSNVSGCLARGRDAVDVIRAVFPGGTITGCPKVRCMQILRALEPVPRELYTGSLGLIAFDGSMDLNIAIRTIVCQGRYLSFHVGAGIVADSLPDREYEETLAKGQALVEALQPTPTDGVPADAPAR